MYIWDMMLVRSVGDSICLYMRTVHDGERSVIAVNAYRYLFWVVDIPFVPAAFDPTAMFLVH